MGIPVISIGTPVCCPVRPSWQCTRYPQEALAPCKTCEQEIFFGRKASMHKSLHQVEKKAAKTLLICQRFVQ
jgi:hypothetical protein